MILDGVKLKDRIIIMIIKKKGSGSNGGERMEVMKEELS